MKHRADLNYLLDNMGAEIAIGHSYVRGGDMPDVPQSPGGLLGADFAIENGRYKITRIYDNESWNPDLRAPLAAPGVERQRSATTSSRSTASSCARPTTSTGCSTARRTGRPCSR